MADLTTLLQATNDFNKIVQVDQNHQAQLVTGVDGSFSTVLLTALQSTVGRPQLVVTDSLFHLQELVNDLQNLRPDQEIYAFPVEEVLATEMATSSPDFRLQRLQALNALQSQVSPLVIVSAAGLRRRLPDPQFFKTLPLSIHVGDDFEIDDLRQRLSTMGYRPEKMVLRPGDFAIRGSIVDIYALNTTHPVRVDFFDTEVDSLRYFEVESQRSIENITKIQVLPATELVASSEQMDQFKGKLAQELANLPAGEDEESHQAAVDNLQNLFDEVTAGRLPNEALNYADWLYPDGYGILDYLTPETTIVLDDWARIKEMVQTIDDQERKWIASQVQNQQRVHQADLANDQALTIPQSKHSQLYLSRFQKGLGRVKLAQLIDLHVRPMQQFFGQLDLLKTELSRWQAQGQTVIILANSPERQRQIATMFQDFDLPLTETTSDQILTGQIQIVTGTLQHGFEFPKANLVVITESELFKQLQVRQSRRQKLANAERIKSYNDLKPGDYVVHVNHGIGIFTGIQTMVVDGVHQDYIVLNYRDHAQIFVPVTQLNLVQKYVSADNKEPRINRLGGTEWAKTKRRIAAKIEDIADELVDLYAAREAAPGYAFPQDDYLQEQFDAAFPYTETPDQLRSVDEIKQDMEKPKPMDRLLVGDVGYGKTEVAMRAIFKAVEGGKQVAFLVPTTILAQQHFETLQTRFAEFPVKIAVLSRFLTPKESTATLEQLAAGEIDVIVGTHRLLSKDVQFHDLGLLIVDEEQRFGVKHKERLKQLKASVDVLTLTATPIPRTLHMSMLGVRDLSVLETPPTGRYPIQTYVLEQNPVVIQDGIRRELQRGGQVYYLHNRVHDIEKVVAEISQLVPEARAGYIHGQMSETQLEGVLYDFIRGEYDVLVTTSIIETGVDISNVNTLFIENADRLGLAQLYQIRGRIGRTNRVAYAYLMYQPNKVLTEQGEQRLSAIRDFTELGSGFKIAMRDLSIRGAGNLLGKQQHGFIDSVGYDLYTSMLTEAVAKRRGKKVTPHSNAELDLGIEAYLPDDYVPDQRQKMELYKQVRQAQTAEAMLDLEGDLIDRYGDYDQPVKNLLLVGQLKAVADQAMLTKIERRQDNLYLTFTSEGSQQIKAAQIMAELAKTKFKATMSESDSGQLQVRLIIQPKMTKIDWLNQLLSLVTGIAQQIQSEEAEE